VPSNQLRLVMNITLGIFIAAPEHGHHSLQSIYVMRRFLLEENFYGA